MHVKSEHIFFHKVILIRLLFKTQGGGVRRGPTQRGSGFDRWGPMLTKKGNFTMKALSGVLCVNIKQMKNTLTSMDFGFCWRWGTLSFSSLHKNDGLLLLDCQIE